MKKIFKYTSIMALAIVALTSCSSKYEYDGPGTWNANDGYAQVSFAKTSLTVELAPTEPTQTTIELKRTNTNGAATVNFDIETNTDDVFTVAPATFADGAETATAVVSFPSAAVGKNYTLKLLITDPTVVSQYSTDNACTLNVIRVQWNDVGFYYKDAAKTEKEEGWAMYTDLVAEWFGGSELTFPTRIQERDDMPGYYRLVNTYDWHFPYNDPESATGAEWWSDAPGITREDIFDYENKYYIYIDATDPKKVFIPSACDLGFDWGYGNFLLHSLSGYYVAQAEAAGDDETKKEKMDEAAKYYGTFENGTITFPKGSLLRGMKNYDDGALYEISSGNFKLVIDPDKALYTATLEDYNFTEVALTGLYSSAKLKSETEDVVMLKGLRDADLEKENPGCYDRFEKANGVPYVIVSPYADGYHLFFCVNAEGKIVIPSTKANQQIGVQAMGEDVYAHINGGASTFGEREVVLNITFQNKAGDVVYGEANESLAYITWTKVGTGMYTYSAISHFAKYDPETEKILPVTDGPYDIYIRDDNPTFFKIAEWGDGAEFIFRWDGETTVTVPKSFTGFIDSYYDEGKIYVSDMPTWSDGYYTYEDYPCEFDAETNTFTFAVMYYSDSDYWGFGYETLEVTWNASEASSRRAAKVHNGKAMKMHQQNFKKFSPFGKGTKVNIRKLQSHPNGKAFE